MQYREDGRLESLTQLPLMSLIGAGVIGIAWNLFAPGGWLFRMFAGTFFVLQLLLHI